MVQNKWKDEDAAVLVEAAGNDPADRELALRVYTSRLIGSDLDLVMHGGGNTSVKLTRRDLFGHDIEVLHVKGSGWDLATIEAAGLPAVRLAPLRELRALEALSDEDMINVQRCNLLDSTSPNPSVETLLHAYLPHIYVDHTHATAMLTLASLPEAEAVVKEIFGDKMAVVPFIMPGFELAKLAAEIYEKSPGVEGLLLLNHGHFAFGATARQSYDRLIAQTNRAEKWIERNGGAAKPPSRHPVPEMLAASRPILPVLRGIVGKRLASFSGAQDAPMPVMDLRAGENVKAFLARPDARMFARRGVATPDHVIRTKNYPLYLDRQTLAGGRAAMARAVDDFIRGYEGYFEQNAARFNDEKTMLPPAPNLAWIEGVGVVGIGANARAASVAADLAEQNLVVMANGEDCGGFSPVSEAQVFDMEYWSLEQAKLGKAKAPKLGGRVVMVTGGGGAIGRATASAFAAQGAEIFLVERDEAALDAALEELGGACGGIALDVTAKGAAVQAVNACIVCFGGLDILVSNAGAAWSGALVDLDEEALRASFELNFFAHNAFSRQAARVFEMQGRGGQILFNVSKQAVNPGKNFGAYGLPKAATFFLLRQLALELGEKGVRVNGVNADRIRSGLLNDDFIAERSRARGIDEHSYMAGNLLKREVEARHVGEAFVALALSERTTAHLLTVDGGNIEAALR